MKATLDVNDAIRRQPGHQDLRGGIDRSSGALVVVSTWDDAGAANFSREALGEAFRRVVALGVQLQPPEIYELVE